MKKCIVKRTDAKGDTYYFKEMLDYGAFQIPVFGKREDAFVFWSLTVARDFGHSYIGGSWEIERV